MTIQTESAGGVRLRDFAVIGDVTDRVDDSPDNFATGSLGAGSEVTGLWLQHLKVGMWLTGNNDDLLVEGNRILDTTADGINLNNVSLNNTVGNNLTATNNFVRGTGGHVDWLRLGGRLARHEPAAAAPAPGRSTDNPFRRGTRL